MYYVTEIFYVIVFLVSMYFCDVILFGKDEALDKLLCIKDGKDGEYWSNIKKLRGDELLFFSVMFVIMISCICVFANNFTSRLFAW